MDLPEPLEKKVGPFTVATWAGVVLAGVIGGLILRRTLLRDEPATAAPVVTGDEPAAGYVAPQVPPYGLSGAGPSYAVTSPMTTAPAAAAPSIRSNLDWLRQAVERLTASGVNDPTTIHAALSTWLRGDPITVAQKAIVDIAVRELGPPPEYVPPLALKEPSMPPPVPTEAQPPPPIPAPPGPGTSLRALSNADLIGTGNHVIVHQGTSAAKPYVDEAIARLMDGRLSVNNPAGNGPNPAFLYPDGKLMPFGAAVIYEGLPRLGISTLSGGSASAGSPGNPAR